MTLLSDAHEVVRVYSTTWYEPVIGLPPSLNEAVTAAYLLMRGVDEIEDHPGMDGAAKAQLLRATSRVLQTRPGTDAFAAVFHGHEEVLPEVSFMARSADTPARRCRCIARSSRSALRWR